MIVDIGCGAGFVLSNLREYLPIDCNMLGLDISQDAIAMAKRYKVKGLDFRVGDHTNIPKDCDLLLVVDVIEHLKPSDQFIKQIKAQSRTIIFHIPLERNIYSMVRFGNLRVNKENFGHLQFFSKNSAINALQIAGLQIIDQFYTPWILELGVAQREKKKLAFAIIKCLYRINLSLAVNVLGGSSLLVVAK